MFVLLRSFYSILKYQVDEMEAEPSSGVLDRAADMIGRGTVKWVDEV